MDIFRILFNLIITSAFIAVTNILPSAHITNTDQPFDNNVSTPSAVISEPSPTPSPSASPKTQIKSAPKIYPSPTLSPKPEKTEAEIKLEQVSKELENIKKSSDEEKKQTNKEAMCNKANDLSEGLPDGMPLTHIYNPSDKTIKGYLDFYKDQAGQEYARNLPADTKFGNWVKAGISGATVEEIKNTVNYLEQKYNEYLEARNNCNTN